MFLAQVHVARTSLFSMIKNCETLCFRIKAKSRPHCSFFPLPLYFNERRGNFLNSCSIMSIFHRVIDRMSIHSLRGCKYLSHSLGYSVVAPVSPTRGHTNPVQFFLQPHLIKDSNLIFNSLIEWQVHEEGSERRGSIRLE